MNDSRDIFPGRYCHVDVQSNGECDFIDCSTGEKYDAKLLFSQKQCCLLAQGIKNLKQWIKLLIEETNEASYKLLQTPNNMKDTLLYKEMKERLESVEDDESAVLFIPYPVVPACEESVYMQFASDIISLTYRAIVNDDQKKYSGKVVYIIYPSILDQKFVLRNLLSDRKEYLPINTLSPYIMYGISDVPNEDADIIMIQ